MARKAYIGIGSFTPRDLPMDYTQVEYIEGTGTQYIDTGLVATEADTIVIVARKSNEINSKQTLFGSRTSATENFVITQLSSNGNYTVYFSSGADYDKYKTFCEKQNNTNWTRITMSATFREIYDLGADETIAKSTEVMTSAITTPHNCYLFTASGSIWATDYWQGGVKSLVWTRNGKLVRDFVPCIDKNGVAGMYDLVERKFYTNKGTGSFIAGGTDSNGVARKIKKMYVGIPTVDFKEIELPDGYTQVEYVESNGTQYIDTGFKANNNTRVVMDFEITDKPTDIHALYGARASTTSSCFVFLWSGSRFRVYYNNSYNDIGNADVTGGRTVDQNKETTLFDDASRTYENVEFATPKTLKLLASDNGGTVRWNAYAKVYSCKIYDNDVLIRNYVPCVNANGIAGLYDLVHDEFYTNAGTGEFLTGEAYIGVPRRIMKAYIGVNGVARLTWVLAGTYWTKSNVGSSVVCTHESNGLWVACSEGSKGLYYSTDGKTWVQSNITKGNFKYVYCVDGLWVAGATSNGIYYSTDGKTWTRSNITSGTCYCIHYANGVFVACCDSSNGIYYSTDGKTWTQSNIPNIYCPSVYYANGLWVACGTGILYSTDGKTWTQSNITGSGFCKVHYAGGLWVACNSSDSSDGGIYYSTDGKEWVQSNLTTGSFYCVYESNGIWVACGTYTSKGLYYSTDGKIWTRSNMTSSSYRYVKEADGLWVACGWDGNGLCYSTDGKMWTQSNNTSNIFQYAHASNNMWVACGMTGGLVYSE